jgi:2-polyprenyl-3-methyl-5-hydroxy-6-metoxy-1,4-benzoquinol methylase
VSHTNKINQCIVCGNKSFAPVRRVEDHLVSHEIFEILECNNCHFRFTQHPPTESKSGVYYEDDDYIEHSDNQKGLIFKLYHFGRKFMLKQKRKMCATSSQNPRLLDVGSASGYFLNHMKETGFNVDGIEISKKARDLCKEKFNISAFEPSALLNKELSGTYDVISLWHVFEHVYTYDEYFESFRHYLNTNGKLLIAMPNYKCLDEVYYGKYWCAYDAPRHLWHFDPKTFERFAKDRGFKLVKLKRLPLDPFYNAMVSAGYKKHFTFLPWTLYIGLLSFIQSLSNKRRSSSIVYILQKTN